MTRDSRHLLIASLPAALIGVFNLGRQIRAHFPELHEGWRIALLANFDFGTGVVATFLTGAIYWLPLLISLLIVSLGWSLAFARSRSRPVDPIWIPAAWLFSLMLPATAPVGVAVVALSFGLVFGCHTFGGTRRYLTNPALVGIVFLAVGYPALVGPGAWIPGDEARLTWTLVGSGATELMSTTNLSLWDAFLGNEVGAIGTTSAAACLFGAAYLVTVKLAPLQMVAGGLIALSTLGMAIGAPPWPWQLAAGNFAFALAFVASDPTTRPATGPGTWAFGAMFGALTFVLRTGNPDHPEGSWAALLLASLCIPLLDRLGRAISNLRGSALNV